MKQASRGIAARALAATAVALLSCLPCEREVVHANEAMEAPAVAYQLDAHILANGSSVTSGNACHRLRATFGEPVAGHASNDKHALSAGFRAAAQLNSSDDLFFTSFEVCP